MRVRPPHFLPTAILALTFLAAIPASAAEEPVYLAFQGRLRTIGGPHAAPESEVTFRLVDRKNGGNVLWEQGPVTLALSDGYFHVVLGDGAPLSRSLFQGERWLEIDCPDCAGKPRYRIETRGDAIAILGAEKPVRPGPAAPKAWLRNQRLHDQRAYPTGIVPGGYLAKAYEAAVLDPAAIQADVTFQAPAGALTEGSWLDIGPSKVTLGQTFGTRGDVSGRVNSLAVHPTDPNVAYVCGAQGGVWKTTSGGASWTPLTDGLPSLASGAIALAPSNPAILYLGTGEANFSIDSYWGAGIFRSVDAGATWTPAAPIDPNRVTMNSAAVAKIAVHPSDPNTVIAAVGTFLEGNRLFSGGVYRTTDGGGGWTRVLGTGLPAGAVAASDLVIDPVDPNVVYAALGYVGGSANNGVYKSTDGGASFAKLAGGLPTSAVGRINLAIAPTDRLVLYVSIHSTSTDTLLGIYRTADGGASWTKKNAISASCSTQCWYDMILAVSPTDANVVYFGGVSLYRSTNAAGNFTDVSAGSGSTGGVHADQHVLVFSPNQAAQLWSGNDGGVWRTDDSNASSPTWVNKNSNLALLQFQSVSVPPSDPNIAYGGTQDNGTIKYSGSNVWSHSDDGDGGQTAVDFVSPSTIYHTYYGVSFRRSDNSGSTWTTKQSGLGTADRSEFYVPVEMDPTNAAVLYLGTYRLYRTSSRGDSWSLISPDLTVDPADPNKTGNISAIGVATTDSNVIFTGSTNAQINVTSNLGGAWTNRKSAPLPNRQVASLAVSPIDANTAFAAYSGFNDPNSGFGHVFKTSDRGVTWSDTSWNLPDIPVSQITIDPAHPQMIYLATDLGPYASANGGQSWRRYAGGLPNVAQFEVAVQQPNLLFAASHGRGMFEAFGCASAGTTDADADGVADFCDNCPGAANAAQTDADHDGFGAPCDCADLNAAIFPGSDPPQEVADDLSLSDQGDLTWSGVPLAEGYDVYRGEINPAAHFAFNHTCLSPGVPGLAVNDMTLPPIGHAWYYLVAAENCAATSGLGPQSSGSPRPNSSPCP